MGDITKIEKLLYTAKAHTTGGRDGGSSRTSDGHLDVKLSVPGSTGTGTNPEQLFAAGFAACFHGALNLLGKRAAMDIADTVVEVQVSFGRDPMDGGYALVIDLRVRMPGVDRCVAEEMVRTAERLCPYAKMARQGTVNIVTVVD